LTPKQEEEMTIARVFPRRTNATPTDDYTFVGDQPLRCFIPEDIDEIHVSVTFTWDLREAERLVKAWSKIAPVKIGGPALDDPGGEFVPGRYLKPGYVMTSRGCDNHCWFCSVPKREGTIRELEIKDGNAVLDSNLLACSDAHIEKVFDMLSRQKREKLLTGGLEAKRLKPWHVERLKAIHASRIYFAYDTPDDKEPLIAARKLFDEAEFGTRSNLYCYCLVGYRGDTFDKAEERLNFVRGLNISPMAMLYRDEAGKLPSLEWRRFQRSWARPAAIWGKRDDRHSEVKPLSAADKKEVA
jgi:hypothetical protein